MKKVFTKTKLTLCVMLLALAAAVVLNMRYSSGTKYLGDAKYVSNVAEEGEAVETAAGVKQDYISEQRSNREKTYNDSIELVEETLKSADATGADKTLALETSALLAKRKTDEQSIEAILSAKDFKNCLVIIGEDSVTVMVNEKELTSAQTLQIKDAVNSILNDNSKDIKIIAVNS